MSVDKARLVPVLCTVHTTTDDSIVLHTVSDDDALTDSLTFNCAKALLMVQNVTAWSLAATSEPPSSYAEVGPPRHALTMTGPQLADTAMASQVIAWIPRWKVDELGIRSMQPHLPETAS